MLEKNTSNNYKSLFISLIVIIFFSLYQINFEDLWFDELLTFSITNPELSNIDTYNLIIREENTPPIYYFLIKIYFNFFGYDYQLLRLPNVIFNVISLLIFFSILNEISKNNKFIFLSSILFSLNFFLIAYSQEARVYSFYLLTSLAYLKFYLKTFNLENSFSIRQLLPFFLLSIILINTFLFSFLIIGTSIFFELIKKQNLKKKILINFILIFSIMISIYLNYDYYEKVISFKAVSINNPNIDFFLFNFFFKDFFGSKIMGFIFLIFFIFSVFILIKKKFLDQKLLYLVLLVFFSYLIPISYGYLLTPILLDKYIIYIIPIIIICISFAIINLESPKKKLIIIFFLIIITFSNQIFKNIKKEIDKPEFTKILNMLNIQNNSNFFKASFMDHKNSYFNLIVENLITQIIENQNLKLEKDDKNKNFWIICYDPSNTFKYCIKDNILLNNEQSIRETITTYQVTAILINQK
tara:strand:- start:3490 stop:4896 length:1407 start_codon:yes stop_codon:yes gene_type:complete